MEKIPTVTLRHLLSFEPHLLSKEERAQFESQPSVQALRKSVRERSPLAGWLALRSHLLPIVEQLLDVDVSALLGEAWSKYGDLFEEAYSQDSEETILFDLAEHKIETKHEPYVEVVVFDRAVARLDFEIDLNFHFEGGVLTVRNRRLMGIVPAKGKIEGAIKFEGLVLWKREVEPFELPEIELGDGVPILPSIAVVSSDDHGSRRP